MGRGFLVLSFALAALTDARFRFARMPKTFISIELQTADCLYADTTEPISIQFFALKDRDIVEKSEKFQLTQRGDKMKQGELRTFTIPKAHNYCKDRKICSELSFVGLFVGDKQSEAVFDTWNANNITVTFNFETHIYSHNFDFTSDGPCLRPLHFWSADFWHRYGPGTEYEERSDEFSIGDEVVFPTLTYII